MADQQEQGGISLFSKLKWVLYGLIGIWVLYSFFGKKSTTSSATDTVEVLEPTEGLITKVQEVQAEVFKIEDEEVVPLKGDSRIIASYMDGTIDTFSLDEVALVDTTITDPNDSRYRNRMIRSVVIGGAMGYLMGRSMSRPLNRSAYSSQSAFNKSSTQARTRMTSTASRRTVSRPSRSGRSGYGSGKSTRSYGG